MTLQPLVEAAWQCPVLSVLEPDTIVSSLLPKLSVKALSQLACVDRRMHDIYKAYVRTPRYQMQASATRRLEHYIGLKNMHFFAIFGEMRALLETSPSEATFRFVSEVCDFLDNLLLLEKLRVVGQQFFYRCLCNRAAYEKAPIISSKVVEGVALALKDVGFTSFPTVLRKYEQLRELNLDNNSIFRIPEWIAQLSQLQTLSLCNNKISQIPEGLTQCSNLSCLALNANRISVLPETLLRVPKLKQLFVEDNGITEIPTLTELIEKLDLFWLEKNPVHLDPSDLPRFMEALTRHSEETLRVSADRVTISRRLKRCLMYFAGCWFSKPLDSAINEYPPTSDLWPTPEQVSACFSGLPPEFLNHYEARRKSILANIERASTELEQNVKAVRDFEQCVTTWNACLDELEHRLGEKERVLFEREQRVVKAKSDAWRRWEDSLLESDEEESSEGFHEEATMVVDSQPQEGQEKRELPGDSDTEMSLAKRKRPNPRW